MKPQHSVEFTRVVRENHASLRFFIRSLGVDAAWVDDIAQESFLLLLKKWDDLRHHDELGAWLRATARHLVRNELRKNSRRPRLINRYLTTLLLEHESSQPRPDDFAADEERKAALNHCLRQLPERTRAVVENRYFRNLNATEIAEALDSTSAAIRRTLFRARRLLADCIARYPSP